MSLQRLRLTLLAAVFLIPAGAGQVLGQGQTTGSIRGQVVSDAGAPVPNAQVVATNAETGFTRGVVANAEGRYGILLLPPGVYQVAAQSIGFSGQTVTEVRVRVNETAPVNFTLGTQAVAVEGITVRGDRARVDARQGGVVQTVTPEQVEGLPTSGRDFTDFINLSPLVSPQPGVGTGGQFSIAGARTSGTNIQIDGADANNAFFGENRGSSRTPFAFSLESIKEFQLVTNGFDVEYGNYQGGVVNAVTKGGTNELRGSAFGYFRGEALTGDDFQGDPPTDFQSQQFGFNLSGPVVEDKLHFFVSLDAQRKDQPLFAIDADRVGISDATVNEIVSIFESRYGYSDVASKVGRFQQAEDNTVVFGRVDWTVNDNHRLTVRQNYSDFTQTNDRISSSGNEALTRGGPFKNKAWSTVGELTSVLGANAFNTLRVQWSDEDRPRDPNPGGYIPEIRIDVENNRDLRFGGDGIIFRNRLEESKLQLIDNFTYQAGDHTFKIGTNNVLTDVANEFWLLGVGAYRFRSVADFRDNRPDSYFRLTRACPVPLTDNAAGERVICPQYDVPFAQFGAFEYSVYAQDDWQVTDRLLITPGVRFDGTRFQDEPGRVTDVENAFGIETGIVPDFSGVSPRLAFTYDFGENVDRVLRGGVGMLVGRAPLVLAGNVFQTEKPLLSVFCSARDGNVPAFDVGEFLSAPRGELNPLACAGGAAPGGRPEYAVFDPDFQLPRTMKANVGYQQVLGTDTRVGVDLIYSQSWDNYNVFDLNLNPQQFTLGVEGRPVFVAQNRYNPTRTASSDRLLNRGFDNVFINRNEAEARSVNVAFEIDQRVSEALNFGARYAHTRAYDNSSFSCCTSGEGYEGTPTAGNPNFIGDVGDDLDGTWGPSSFERRHAFVFNFLWSGPLGINASGIWRSQSGTPWTPIVDGDLNGDGADDNDRAFVGSNLRFDTPEDAATFQRLLDENACLRDQQGRIAQRNSCRDPWFHSVDLRLAKDISTFSGQRAELVVDVFNVLNGLNSDWGRFMGVFGSSAELLEVEGYDSASNSVIYSVNPGFGEERAVGFDPFQFQMQIGVRYSF